MYDLLADYNIILESTSSSRPIYFVHGVCVLLGHLLTTLVVVGQSILCIVCVLLDHLLTTLVVVGQSILCMVCVSS